MSKNNFYSFFCLFSSAEFWVWCDPITWEAAVWAINGGIEPLTKILWQNQVLLFVHGSAAVQPCLGFRVVLLVGAHVEWVKGNIAPSCTYNSSSLWDSPVSLHDPLNLDRGWWQLASLYTSLQTVLATRLPRTAPKNNKTKGRIGAHEPVWRRLIWTWMEGKLPAGQSYSCILTQIFVMEACFSDRWW